MQDSQEIEKDNIVFTVENGAREVIRLAANGDIFVHGRLIENDKEIVEGFRDFLRQAGLYRKEDGSGNQVQVPETDS